jgi:hypothetical protein
LIAHGRGNAPVRPGLKAMLRAFDEELIEVVVTFATNRLHRKMHLALKVVEEGREKIDITSPASLMPGAFSSGSVAGGATCSGVSNPIR